MIPGQSHIPGNVGAESIDYLLALESWVEQNKAPDMLLGRKLKTIRRMLGPIVLESDLVPENWLYSRPHYPYPIQGRYRGKGDPDDAASFAAWDPDKKRWIR
jgi:feruloyl esterase